MMTETQVEVMEEKGLDSKIPCLALNDILMDNAREADAPRIRPAREKTGSTDFGNIMHRIPGSCIRVAFVKEDASSHSLDYVEAGKSKEAHGAILCGAKILCGAAADLIREPELLKQVKAEFAERLAAEQRIK